MKNDGARPGANPEFCPSEDAFNKLLSGELAKPLETQFADHISTCVDCQLRIESLSGGEEIHQMAETEKPASLEIKTLVSDLIRQRRSSPMVDVTSLLDPTEDEEFIGTFGNYQIIQVIGQGGMGVVFKARDPGLDRIVALKTLLPAAQSNAKARERFKREAKNAAAVNHANVVTIHSVEVHKDMPFIVMEFVNGRSLQDDLDSGQLTEMETLRISLQIAKALESAHEQGLIHRDIKPANVLLVNGIPRVMVTDFGLARAANDVSITNPDAIAGTPNYMSPEQADAGAVDGQSDMFSLGCVMYRMCTGKLPFDGESPLSVIRQVCDHEPVAPRQVNSEVRPWASDLIVRLLSKDPKKRPSASQVVVLLEDHLSEGSAGKRRSQSLPIVTWVVVGAFLILAAVLFFNNYWAGDRTKQATGKQGTDVSKSEAGTEKNGDQGNENNSAENANVGVKGFLLKESSQRFESLAEAIENASDGETIVVDDEGPFKTSFIGASNKSLTICAAQGISPVIISVDRLGRIMRTDSSLVLKGLIFQTDKSSIAGEMPAIRAQKAFFEVHGDNFSATDCTFSSHDTMRSLTLNCAETTLTNCFLSPASNSPCIQMLWKDGGKLIADNCVLGGRGAFVMDIDSPQDFSESFSLSIRNTTMKGICILGTMFTARPNLQVATSPLIQVETENCLFGAEMIFSMKPMNRIRTTDTNNYKKFLPKLVSWKDKKSFYSESIKPMVVRDRIRVLTIVDHDQLDFWREHNQISSEDQMIGQIEFEAKDSNELSAFKLKSTTPKTESSVGADINLIQSR